MFQIYKKTRVEVFACLGSSHGFLSTIFGILRKFWVDIGKHFFQKIIFQDQKIFAKKKFGKHFQIFFKTKIEILKNRKVENSKSWNVRIFNFSNFRFFKSPIFVLKKIWKWFSSFRMVLYTTIYTNYYITYRWHRLMTGLAWIISEWWNPDDIDTLCHALQVGGRGPPDNFVTKKNTRILRIF